MSYGTQMTVKAFWPLGKLYAASMLNTYLRVLIHYIEKLVQYCYACANMHCHNIVLIKSKLMKMVSEVCISVSRYIYASAKICYSEVLILT